MPLRHIKEPSSVKDFSFISRVLGSQVVCSVMKESSFLFRVLLSLKAWGKTLAPRTVGHSVRCNLAKVELQQIYFPVGDL